jgi:hypothetical protein
MCPRQPVVETQPRCRRCIGTGETAAGAGGVREQVIPRTRLEKRFIEELGKRVLRKNPVRILPTRERVLRNHGVEVIVIHEPAGREFIIENCVWEKSVRNRGSMRGVAVRRPCFHC